MFRTILKPTLLATLFLATFCSNVATICGNENTVVADDEKSQIGIEVDIAQLMKDKVTAAMLDSNPQVPPFVKSMTGLSVYVALPGSMAEMQDPSSVNFYAKLSFSKMGDCEAAFEEMFANAPIEEVEKNGKTYHKISEAGSPDVYILQDGKSIQAYSAGYVDSSANKFASKGLAAALKKAPKNEPFKMAFDVEGAKDLLEELSVFAPQAEAFSKAKSITMAGGGKDDLMFMMSVATPDESTAKKIKSTLQTGLAFIAAAVPSQMPSEDDAPAMNEMINHVMGKLRPKVDGTTVKLVINKPDNYEELRKKMADEAKALEDNF